MLWGFSICSSVTVPKSVAVESHVALLNPDSLKEVGPEVVIFLLCIYITTSSQKMVTKITLIFCSSDKQRCLRKKIKGKN